VLGKSVDEVKKAYKDAVSVQGHDVSLLFLPTEWDRFWTRVNVVVTAGKVSQLSFALPYKPHPEARDELYALFTHKWGEPHEIEDEGQAVLLFHEAEPRVEVRDDVIHGAWRFEVR
jgi:hypothetical protein